LRLGKIPHILARMMARGPESSSGRQAPPGKDRAAAVPHHGNRHGRSEAARIAILEAADDLLVERGYAGVTIEGIAARAGVAKQTIYRWWTAKASILFEALDTDAAEHFTAADHGDLGSDLRDHLRQLAVFLTATDAGAVCRALAGEAQHDPAVAARFQAEFVARQRERDQTPFLRARGRGELAESTDIDLAIDQLAGPVYYRILVTGQPAPPQFTDALVQSYLSAGNGAADRSSPAAPAR
jgi:AcrR family transcriptional regulator